VSLTPTPSPADIPCEAFHSLSRLKGLSSSCIPAERLAIQSLYSSPPPRSNPFRFILISGAPWRQPARTPTLYRILSPSRRFLIFFHYSSFPLPPDPFGPAKFRVHPEFPFQSEPHLSPSAHTVNPFFVRRNPQFNLIFECDDIEMSESTLGLFGWRSTMIDPLGPPPHLPRDNTWRPPFLVSQITAQIGH